MLLLLLESSLFTNEKSVIWLLRHWPPYSIYEGELANQGYGQKNMEIIKENMPDIQFDIEKGINLSRMLKWVEKGYEMGAQALIKTPEREKLFYYSIPAEVHLPHRIFFLGTNKKVFKGEAPKVVSLKSLVDNKDLKFGVEEGRSYGEKIDGIISKSESLFERSAAESQGIITMILNGRIDYIVEYPANVAYYFRDSPEKLKQLSSIAIEESNEPLIGHYVFTKTEFGKEFIERLNEILRRELPKAPYRTNIEKWLDPASLETYRKEYKRLLLDDL